MRIKEQLTGAYKSFQSLSQYAGLGRKGKQLLHCCAYPKGRRLQIEELEERQLLAVTAAEYAEIQTTYADLGLFETTSGVNIIEVESNDLSVSSLKTAIETAGTTQGDDLIVLRTTGANNTITYAKAEDLISIELDSSLKGKLAIIGFGAQAVTINANSFTRGLTISEGAVVQLGNMTVTSGVTSGSGGGIMSLGTLVLDHCTVINNTSLGASGTGGGGIYSTGDLKIYQSVIKSNSSNDNGAEFTQVRVHSLWTIRR